MSTAAAIRRVEPLVEGEYAFTQRNFDEIAQALRATSGIALSPAKATLVYSRLAKRLRKLGLSDFDAYCALVQSPEGEGERIEMLAALTTNVTRFFREPHHFEHLHDVVAPRLIETAKRGGRVRLWSAACSSGEEAYSIALTLLDCFPDAGRHDVRILASDIDPKMVARARRGIYQEEVVSPIPPAMRQRWLAPVEEGGERMWSVRDEVRALITFKELNLIGEWPMRGAFDVIFCRNVVIYFEETTQQMLWTRFRQIMAPGARLYVGHSERVDVAGYESDGLTIYRGQGDAR